MAQEVQELEEERVKICDKMKSREAKKATKRVSLCLFQAFDVAGDGGDENRGGNGGEEKDGAVG